MFKGRGDLTVIIVDISASLGALQMMRRNQRGGYSLRMISEAAMYTNELFSVHGPTRLISGIIRILGA